MVRIRAVCCILLGKKCPLAYCANLTLSTHFGILESTSLVGNVSIFLPLDTKWFSLPNISRVFLCWIMTYWNFYPSCKSGYVIKPIKSGQNSPCQPMECNTTNWTLTKTQNSLFPPKDFVVLEAVKIGFVFCTSLLTNFL